MSIVLSNNLSFNSRQLPDVSIKEYDLNLPDSTTPEQLQQQIALLTANSGKSGSGTPPDALSGGPSFGDSGQISSEVSANAEGTSESQDEGHKKRRRARKLLRRWKQSVKQKLHMTEYNQNGVYTNNQGTITSMSELKDALSCYYRFKTDESKIEEMFETIMFRNTIQSPPLTRDQELRELVPFEIIGEQKLADLKKKLDVFSNCLSALDDDKPWNQPSAFSSPPVDFSKAPRSAIGGSSSPPELVSGISTLDSAAASDSLEKSSFCQMMSGEECAINGSNESVPGASCAVIEGGQQSGSSKTSSIVEKLASFVRMPNTSETSPMDSVGLSSPLDSEFEVQRLVIPTFRMNAGKNLDISHIVENLKSGTITERDLLYLASMYTSQEVGFMDKSFYDEQGNEADTESAMTEEYGREHPTVGTDEKGKVVPATQSNTDSVKFDRFSYLVIYNASKKCDSSKLKRKSTDSFRDANDLDSTRSFNTNTSNNASNNFIQNTSNSNNYNQLNNNSNSTNNNNKDILNYDKSNIGNVDGMIMSTGFIDNMTKQKNSETTNTTTVGTTVNNQDNDALSKQKNQTPSQIADSGYDGDDEDGHSVIATESEGSCHKSILKSKKNDKEFLESQRAVKCDKVSVEEFLEFFDKYETERREGDSVLSLVREKQLRNYYSKNHFPEFEYGADPPMKDNTDFARSKLATEHNIGREFLDNKPEVMNNCFCTDCGGTTDAK